MLNAIPSLSVSNPTDFAWMNAEHFTDVHSAHRWNQFSNLLHRILSKLTAWPSTFLDRILNVFLLCPQKQMIRVNTIADIAPMKNPSAFWDAPITKFPSEAMGANHFWVAMLSGPSSSISSFGLSHFPQPTTIPFDGNFVREEFVNHLRRRIPCH